MMPSVKSFSRLRSRWPGIFLLALAAGAAAGQGGTATMPMEAGGPFAVPVASIKELRFRQTIRQQYDFSCGSAALATLLTHHYGYPVGEQDVFREMYERGDKAKIRREGFSLLDIKNYLAAHGFAADGFVAELDRLTVARVPAIALIREHGYYHFVVLKGMRDGRVLIGDPSTGSRALRENDFRQLWVNRILFVILSHQERARFNVAGDWRAAPAAPIAEGMRSATYGMPLPKLGPADF